MVRTKCPKCQSAIALDAIPAGGRVFCSGCGHQLIIKAPAAPPAAPSRPVPAVKAPPPPQVVDDEEVIELKPAKAPSAPIPVIPITRATVVSPGGSSISSGISKSKIVLHDDGDNRPRKLKKKKKRGTPAALWIPVAAIAVLVLVGSIILIYLVMSSGDKDIASKHSNPGGPVDVMPADPSKKMRQPGGEPDDGIPALFSPDRSSEKTPPAKEADSTSESSVQPHNFGGGASESGGGVDVYPYVLKSATFIVSALNNRQGYSLGSGALIDKKNRLVLTNHHVAGDVRESVVFFPSYDKSGKLISSKERFLDQFKNLRSQKDVESRLNYAKLVDSDARRDLCIIQLAKLPPGVEALPICAQSPRVGQRVHSVGNPGSSAGLWLYAPGIIRQMYRRTWRARDEGGATSEHEADIIETQSPTNHGDSGGPLVNDRGEIVGLTQGIQIDPERGGVVASIFIDVSEIRDFVSKAVEKKLNVAWAPDTRAPLALPGAAPAMVAASISDLVKKLSSAEAKDRAKAAEMLGEMGEKAKDAIPSLLKLLGDPDDFTKRTAVSALGKIGLPSKADLPLVMKALQDTNVEQRRYAAATLEKMGPDARAAASLLVLALVDADGLVRQAAARALGRLGREVKETAQKPLEHLLGDEDKDNRLAAAEGLAGVLGSTGDVDGLRKLLKHSDPDIQLYAVKALSRLGRNAKPVIADLLEIAKVDVGEMRRTVLRILAQIDLADAKPGVPLAVESLRSGDKETKLAALAVLSTHAKEVPASAVTSLREAIKDAEIKSAGIEALGKLAAIHKAAMPILVELLKDGEEATSEAAKKAIENLGAAAVSAVPELIKLMDITANVITPADDAMVRKYASVIGKIGKPAVPQLIRGLNTRSITRWGCAIALGEIGPSAGQEAIRALQTLLQQEPNDFVRKDIEDAINKIRGR